MMKIWAIGLSVLANLSFGLVCRAADFNGDGTGDIAIFRAGSGLWSVRGVTRMYFGASGDNPVPGDYDGSGTDRAAIFRANSALWSVRDLTRVYFGSSTDEPKIGDYNGDGREDFGIFRPAAGLWAAYNITRVYFGTSADTAIAPGKTRRGGLLKTGQTDSYRAGDDGYYERGNAFRYADHGNGTVTDLVNGLMWAKDGQGAGCANGAAKNWNDAVDWAESLDFAGHTDWRLPNRRELESLVDLGTWGPCINPIFTNTNSYNYYWSSTTLRYDSTEAWCVAFGAGLVEFSSKGFGYYVRAVR